MSVSFLGGGDMGGVLFWLMSFCRVLSMIFGVENYHPIEFTMFEMFISF